MILRTLTALASPAGARSRLSAFYFHRTLERPDPLLPGEPDARMFDSILQWIGSQFRVLDPLEACERLYDGSLPSRAAIISFDDGYRDNYTVALPLLLRRRMPAVFFVATGFLGDGAMFNDRVIEAVRRCPDSSLRAPAAGGDGEAVYPIGSDAERRTAIHRILAAIKHLHPEEREERVRRLEWEAGVVPRSDLMMDASQVAALHQAGMRVGGHTRSHPILRALPDAQAEAEIRGGADDLAAIVGQRPALFAYPNGRHGKDFDERHVRMVERTGFAFAFTTEPGAADRRSLPFELPRFTPWDRTPSRFAIRALRNLVTSHSRYSWPTH